MDIFTISDLPLINNLIDSARRESIDSGLSLSPSSPVEALTPPIKKRNKKKKRLASTLSYSNFADLYKLKNEVLGQGSYGRVETCINVFSGEEYAVKIISEPTMKEMGYTAAVCREIGVLRTIHHPSVARLVSAFRWRE